MEKVLYALRADKGKDLRAKDRAEREGKRAEELPLVIVSLLCEGIGRVAIILAERGGGEAFIVDGLDHGFQTDLAREVDNLSTLSHQVDGNMIDSVALVKCALDSADTSSARHAIYGEHDHFRLLPLHQLRYPLQQWSRAGGKDGTFKRLPAQDLPLLTRDGRLGAAHTKHSWRCLSATPHCRCTETALFGRAIRRAVRQAARRALA
mmetsp:Transcript_23089/g.46182  ORF Transcript_23089/g.46182 Transcript_23089/m.46182 type:complete len:207 (+) Transcript_23089:2481-3101(+)